MTPGPIGHKAIFASAGSGKTQALAHRYIRVLAAVGSPDGICTLTFSRNAAGEILGRVVTMLGGAAQNTAESEKLARETGLSGYSCDDFRRLLRNLMDRLNRVEIGTMDSFCVRVARAFAGELGIDPDFELSEGDDSRADEARKTAMSHMFQVLRKQDDVSDTCVESIETATGEKSTKCKVSAIKDFVRTLHGLFKLLPDESDWGGEKVIWKRKMPYQALNPNTQRNLADTIRDMIFRKTNHGNIGNNFPKLIEKLIAYHQGSKWDSSWDDQNSLCHKLMTNLSSFSSQATAINYYKKDLVFDTGESKLLYEVISHVMFHEINRCIQFTRGIHGILKRFHASYMLAQAGSGILTFDDVQHLLSGTRRLSGNASDSTKLHLDYRMDCRFNHMLIDEFQDTSDLQWEVFENLIDEIIQDDSGLRSYFMVGDIKQAIYGWRGGNPGLTEMILDRYNTISKDHLVHCRRSGRSIIEFVNMVFSNLDPQSTFFPDAADKWKGEWAVHQVPEVSPEPSFACVITAQTSDIDPPWCQAVWDILETTDPVTNGLSVGILVRKNSEGETLYEYLRGRNEKLPLILEKSTGLRENPVIELLLSLVRLASHPGDRFSWRHIGMSPLQSVFKSKEWSISQASRKLLHQIDDEGFAGFITDWSDRLKGQIDLSEFEVRLIRDLIDVSIEYDALGNRNCDRFIAHIKTVKMVDSAGIPGGIHIMTVHKAKGLGFDLVVVPHLSSFNESDSPTPLELHRDSKTRKPSWILKMPPRTVCEADPVLKKAKKERLIEKAYEELCILYVAVTRAKHGLYLIVDNSGSPAGDHMKDSFVQNGVTSPGEIQFAQNYYPLLGSFGDQNWFRNLHKPDSEANPKPSMLDLVSTIPEIGEPRAVLNRSEPSGTVPPHKRTVNFSKKQTSLDLGSLVHELFARVGWTQTSDPERIVSEWKVGCLESDDMKDQASEHFLKAMQSQEIQEALEKPLGEIVLWREQAFDVIVDGCWIPGKFDRVVIVRDEAGRPVSAGIMDFKSNRISSQSEVTRIVSDYTAQMELYRNALARILNLDAEKISRDLIFTGSGKVHRMT